MEQREDRFVDRFDLQRWINLTFTVSPIVNINQGIFILQNSENLQAEIQVPVLLPVGFVSFHMKPKIKQVSIEKFS